MTNLRQHNIWVNFLNKIYDLRIFECKANQYNIVMFMREEKQLILIMMDLIVNTPRYIAIVELINGADHSLSTKKVTYWNSCRYMISYNLSSFNFRSFEKRDRLRIHILHVHEKHRPHTCGVCAKSFSQSSSLNKHMRVCRTKVLSFVINHTLILLFNWYL